MKSDPQFSDRVGYHSKQHISIFLHIEVINLHVFTFLFLFFKKPKQLKDRSSVNLKDKYRDLVKHGKVPHIVENDDEEG